MLGSQVGMWHFFVPAAPLGEIGTGNPRPRSSGAGLWSLKFWGALAFCARVGWVRSYLVGVGLEAGRGDPGRDSLLLGPPCLGEEKDLVLSPAVSRMGVGL